MGCALNSTHVISFSLFFLYYFLVLFCCISESLGLGWPDLLLWIWKCCLLTITAKLLYLKKKEKVALGRKYVVSAEACRDSGQPQAIDVLLEWCVAYSRMSKSRICCRPGLNNNAHLPDALLLHSKMWRNRSDPHPRGCITPTNTEWGATGSVAPLLDHSLRSTEALRHICMFSHCCINYGWNTDSVLLIYARPTLPLTLLAISKTTDIFLPGEEKGFSGLGSGWGRGGLGWVHHCPQKQGTLILTHIL